MFKSTYFLLKKSNFFLLLLLSLSFHVFSQSSNCATATQITLVNGAACVNGTNVGAITDNILYGACNAAPVNMVWYTYVTNGSNNTFTVDPGTMTNAEIVIYQGNCPNGPGAALQTCTTAAGGTNIINNWGMTAGTQVWIGIASTTLNDGTFQFCVNSQPPAAGAGFTCAQAIPLCSTASFPYTTMPANSSGQAPTCFGSAPQRDIWVKFTCTQSGLLAWKATPSVATTEFDWALWDISASCPGTNICCNYNYAAGSNAGFGMISQAGTAACGINSLNGDPQEYCAPVNIVCGKTYAIQISNYNNTNNGFTLTFPGTTAGIGSTSNFSVSPQLVCGASLNAAIVNSSTGTCGQVWNYGDGSATYTGGSPANHNYTTPGTYAITANTGGACPSSFTQYVQLLAPLAATISAVPVTCPGLCNGTAKLNDVTGGNGVYSYSWSTGATTSSVTGLCAGIYSVTITNTVCGTSITKTVSVTAPPPTTLTANSNAPFCIGGTLNLTASGASTYTWTGSGLTTTTGAAVSTATPATGIYSVSGTSSVGCVSSNTVNVVINPKPLATLSFTNPTCGNNNGQIFINNTSCCAQTISSFASSLGSVSGQTVTGLGAGTPVITLTNSFGCTFTVSATLTMTPGPTNITLVPTNATCGNNNGSFTFGSPVGGTPTYSYSINGGVFSATSPTTGVAPGTYSVTIKDANGCVFTKTTSIVNIPGPTAIAGTASPATCAGATGSYTVTGVTGGTPTYSYSLDGGGFATTSTFGSLATGTHSITVKDANGCTFPTTFNVGLTAGITSATVNASTASCGSSNGTATVSAVTGGVPTYSYSYDGGTFTTSATTSSLTAGSHTVIIKDVNTCTLSVPYTVVSLGSPTTSIASFSNVTCFGLSNGSCTVAIPTGGAGAPFTYTLTTPTQIAGPTVGTGQFSGLPAGTYNISVKDAAGCIATTSVVITQPSQVSITPSSLPALCNGAATGTINVLGTGGTAGYTYNLNNGTYQASTVFANQFAGTYNMGIKDANGCLATQSVVVTQPTALAITVASQNANCISANGIGTATVTGGIGPLYTYTWTGGGGASSTSNGVVSGSYTVTATDANGCVISSPVVIGLTPGGTAAITASTNATCNGLCNGSLTSGMTGGSAPFTYSWTSTPTQTTQTATGLCPGTYSCVITDFYGCKSTAVGTITQPPVLTSIMNSNNVKCFNTPTGTVSASGTGGTGPYTYLWPALASTLSTVPNVANGVYSCVITDANSCSITSTITVTQPTSITLTSSVTAANCGQANGSGTITISGGSSPYSQTWSCGSTTTVQSNVVAGTCTISVQDANNCLQTLGVTIPNIVGPSISVTSQTNVTCFGLCNGVATTSVSGGVTPYNYSWSNGQVTSSGTNLCAGLYTVSATDAAGCVTSTSVSISQPTALTVTISPTNPKCFGATNGFGVAAAFGGTPTYTYSWGAAGNAATSNQVGAGNYGLSVTDGNGCVVTSSMALTNPPAMAASITSTNVTCFNACNGTAIATTTNAVGAVSYVWTGGASPVMSQTLTGACAGVYTALATDQNSCTASAVVVITQPTQVTANIASTGSVTCFGGNNGFAVVTPGGGTGAFTYTWTPSGGNAATASTLTAGSYIATVADANGCTATTTATIIQPSAFTTTLTTTNVKCNGACDGTGNIVYAGGVGIPTFLWQPGLQAGASVNNLCVGSQTVTITSNGSCTNVLTFTLTEPAALTAVASATNSNCGQANGRVCVVVSGGTTPYTNNWSNGITTLCNNGLLAGAYTYNGTDANGCLVSASGLVNDIAGPVVSVTSQTNINCFGGTNGAATTTITGGVTPYGFQWSGSPTFTTQNVSTGFNVGIKNITVTDAAGCVGTASVDITQPTQLASAIGSFTNVSCFGLNNGGATMLVNGGTPNYSYSWIPGVQTSSVMVGVGANTYTCHVTDGNGCTTSQQVAIVQPQPLVISASSFTNVSCFGGNNGQISTTIQGGTPIYSYTWTPAQVNPGPFLSGLTAGGYSLSLTDLNNCAANINFTILQPSALTSTYTSLPATCGNANGSATVTVGGGTPSYSVSWNTAPVQNGLIATNMAAGNNWLAVITDAKGCSMTQTISIANPTPVSITGTVVIPPTCAGLSNGTITVNYSPGTAPYTINWSNPISQTVTTSALTQSVSGVAGGLYNVTVVDNYGCSASQPINVIPPSPLVLVPSANVTICYGQSTQISASGNGGTPGYTYSWTPNTLTGGGPITVNPTTSTSYNVFATDANGCTTIQKTITVAVTPQLTMSGQLFTRCEGETATLTPNIISAGNGGPYNFTWSNGVTTTSAMTSSILVTAVLPSPNQYTVSIDDGCTIMSPNATAVFTVIVNPNPVIDFGVPTIGCSPLSTTLTGTSSGAGDIFTWTSDRTGALGQGNPITPVFVDPGKYSITLVVTNANGCSTTLTKPDFIEVYPQPIASFYADPSATSILDPNINFINTSQGATNYYWDFGDPAAINGSNISTAINPSHSYTFVGPYSVHLIVTSLKGCKDTAIIVVEITPDFAVYIPNAFSPDGNGVNDVFQPMGVGIDEENYRMDVFDRWGENIFTSNNFRKGWDGSVKGNSKTAPQGVYTYKILIRDTRGNKHPYVGHVTVIRESQQ